MLEAMTIQQTKSMMHGYDRYQVPILPVQTYECGLWLSNFYTRYVKFTYVISDVIAQLYVWCRVQVQSTEYNTCI